MDIAMAGKFSVLLVLSTLFVGCGGGSEGPDASGAAPPASIAAPSDSDTTARPASVGNRTAAPAATQVRVVTTKGEFVIELFDAKSPMTVHNFLRNYTDSGFYTDTIIHHVETGVMLAAGGFDAQFAPKPTQGWIVNESDNGLSNVAGTVTMARDPQYPDSATSQFFINLRDNPEFDHQASDDSVGGNGYCVFGKVVKGMDVIEAIASEPVKVVGDFSKAPATPVLIRRVERLGPSS